MKQLAAIGILVLLGTQAGCATLDSAETEVASKGAKAADEVVKVSEFALCRGITVGAWVRRYGTNKALADAWRVICGTAITETP